MDENQLENSPKDHNCEDIVIITKNQKILHKIYTKTLTYIKSAYGMLSEANYSLIVTRVMRELNKETLYGFEKRRLCLEIMILLLDICGCPDTISKFTAEATLTIIESIYNANMHRYKTERKCIIL